MKYWFLNLAGTVLCLASMGMALSGGSPFIWVPLTITGCALLTVVGHKADGLF